MASLCQWNVIYCFLVFFQQNIFVLKIRSGYLSLVPIFKKSSIIFRDYLNTSSSTFYTGVNISNDAYT